MRYKEFKLTEDELFELNMSPTNLFKMAKDIKAKVGIEFELIVPNIDSDDDGENEVELDLDMNEPVSGTGWASDVMDFFTHGDNPNSRGQVQYVIDAISEEYWDWFYDYWSNKVDSDKDLYQEIFDLMKSDYLTQGDDESDEKFDERAKGIANNGEREWDEAAEEVRDNYREENDEELWREFLEENNFETMLDIYNDYSGRLEWPHWTYQENNGDVNIDDLADDFSRAVGKPVKTSRSYHGVMRNSTHYIVEPDSSLEGDDGESGLEFVSPPLSVLEMLADIDRVAEWAGRVGAYTNESTGLHMNVSVPNQRDLDYVKLAMFLGDDYILKQFGREGNSYCKSSMKKIMDAAREDPSRVEEMLRQFQGGLNKLASKIIHTGNTDKYTSINNRDSWIEFRGPGGNWLTGSDGLDTVKNTLLRTVVALDVATDPESFKQEYYKKLYKTLTPVGDDDTIQYFAKYASGKLPRDALKSFIKQIQQRRKTDKEKLEIPLNFNQESGDENYEIYNRSSNEVAHRFIANTDAEARSKFSAWLASRGLPGDTAAYSWRRIAGRHYEPQQPTARLPQGTDRQRGADALRTSYPHTADGNFEIYSISHNNTIYRFNALNVENAQQVFSMWQDYLRHPSLPADTFRLRRVEPAQLNNYEVSWTLDGESGTAQHRVRVMAPSEEAAADRIRNNLEQTGRRVASINAAQINEPAWRSNTSQQAPWHDSLPAGSRRWQIMQNNQELYSFINRDDQASANEYAISWLDQHMPDWREQRPIIVVPMQ